MTTLPGTVVVTRKVGRGVRIGRGVTVTVTAVNGETVNLAIEAPRDHAVSRDDVSFEVHLELQHARERGERITAAEAMERVRRGREGDCANEFA